MLHEHPTFDKYFHQSHNNNTIIIGIICFWSRRPVLLPLRCIKLKCKVPLALALINGSFFFLLPSSSVLFLFIIIYDKPDTTHINRALSALPSNACWNLVFSLSVTTTEWVVVGVPTPPRTAVTVDIRNQVPVAAAGGRGLVRFSSHFSVVSTVASSVLFVEFQFACEIARFRARAIVCLCVYAVIIAISGLNKNYTVARITRYPK